MPVNNVEALAQDLHQAGAINLNTKLSDILALRAVGEIDPLSTVASGAVAWDGYVIVYKGQPAGVEELARVARLNNQVG
ncbi:hypothetical protein C6A85_000000114185 [Mycobacterium sp. ITM-2017-0098]|nr:hypothetical protein C6A85_000000114185 [Mycobacterium sp. ITM-2017-0098]